MAKDIRVKVVVADGYGLVRAGMRALVDGLKGMSVIGEARNGREALTLAGNLSPHILLMDAAMPDLNGIDATRQATCKFPQVKVIVVSAHAAEESVTRALEAGALGYLLKDSTPRDLEYALRVVLRGERYLSRGISEESISRYIAEVGPGRNPLEVLSPRQREVAQLMSEGNTTKEIAFQLQVSPKTVEAHRAQLMARLRIRNLPDLVRWSIRNGLVQV